MEICQFSPILEHLYFLIILFEPMFKVNKLITKLVSVKEIIPIQVSKHKVLTRP